MKPGFCYDRDRKKRPRDGGKAKPSKEGTIHLHLRSQKKEAKIGTRGSRSNRHSTERCEWVYFPSQLLSAEAIHRERSSIRCSWETRVVFQDDPNVFLLR